MLTKSDLQEMINNGTINGMVFTPDELPEELYHNCQAITRSALWTIASESPAAYHHRYLAGCKTEPTEAMKAGSRNHMCFLEPDKFQKTYARYQKVSGTGSVAANLAMMEEIEENGQIPIEAKEYDQLLWLRERFYAHQAAQVLGSDDCLIENAFFAFHPEHDLLMAVKPDIIAGNVILDLKFTSSIPPKYRLAATLEDYGYHLQAVYYAYVVGLATFSPVMPNFGFIFIETSPPYRVKAIKLKKSSLDVGKAVMDDGLARLAECYQTNNFSEMFEPADIRVQTILDHQMDIKR